MGYAQAVALNKQLEDRGILDKAQRNDPDLRALEDRAAANGVDWTGGEGDRSRPAVKRKKGKGAKPKSKRGSGFS